MAELHPSIAEFIKDEEAEYSTARILSTVRQLQQEGRKTRSIARGLLKSILTVSTELGPLEDYSFMLRTSKVFENCIDGMEKELDNLSN